MNAADKLKRTPLHLAAFSHSPLVIEKLLTHGADASSFDRHGNTALHYAVDAVGVGPRGISALAHAHPLAALQANEHRKTPLHIIVGADRRDEEIALKSMLSTLPRSDIAAPPLLLSPRSERGHTPLHLAVLERKANLVRILVSSGAEVNTRDQLGRTPLDCAVRDMDQRIVALLLAAGASTRRLFDETGLLVHVKDYKICEMLLEASFHPMKLSSLCRCVISRMFGPKLQRNLEELPLMWRDFLSYEEL